MSGCQRNAGADHDAGEADMDAHAIAPRDAGLDQTQQLINGEREERGDHAAEQHEDPVLGLQP